MSAAFPAARGRGSQQNIRSKAMPPRPPSGPRAPATHSPRARTSHACDRCRVMRTKCSGGARCTKCVKDNQVCSYGDGKRERNKKELAESSERIEGLENEVNILLAALRTISLDPSFNVGEHQEVIDMLTRYDQDLSQTNSFIGGPMSDVDGDPMSDGGPMSDSVISPIDPRFHDSRGSSTSRQSGNMLLGGIADGDFESWGEKHTSATVGSPGTQDQLSEAVDLGRGTGAAGFMGKMSEVSWIQRAKEHLLAIPLAADEVIETMQIQYDRHTRDSKKSNYFMDDVDLLSIDEDHVIAQEMPPPELSFILAEAYFHAIQGAFVFVHRERFLDALAHFPRSHAPLSWGERRWLALANLVFALGAKWLQQTEPDGSPIVYNHLEFYARARALGLDHRIVFDHPVLEQIQALGMLAFYLLMNGSIFRSWTILGHAIRHATALGLHLRVADNAISASDRVRRAHTWHSLYCLEILVSEVTGRPRAVAISDITTPIDILEVPTRPSATLEHSTIPYAAGVESRKQWLKFLQKQRPSSRFMLDSRKPLRSLIGLGTGYPASHFTHRIRLCFISHSIGTALYSANEDHSWSDLQDRTNRLEAELVHWHRSLPPELTLQGPHNPHMDPRSKIELAMYYYSVCMILHRPCLCNIDIDNESPQSKSFDLLSARKCVEAAISMVEVMPNLQTAQEGFMLLPWWALLHYTSQAIAILLLEMCLNTVHFPGELDRLVSSLKRAMHYLYRMTSTSRSAYKAWKIFRNVLENASAEFAGLDISDIPIDAPQPLNWDPGLEASLHELGFRQDAIVL